MYVYFGRPSDLWFANCHQEILSTQGLLKLKEEIQIDLRDVNEVIKGKRFRFVQNFGLPDLSNPKSCRKEFDVEKGWKFGFRRSSLQERTPW